MHVSVIASGFLNPIPGNLKKKIEQFFFSFEFQNLNTKGKSVLTILNLLLLNINMVKCQNVPVQVSGFRPENILKNR